MMFDDHIEMAVDIPIFQMMFLRGLTISPTSNELMAEVLEDPALPISMLSMGGVRLCDDVDVLHVTHLAIDSTMLAALEAFIAEHVRTWPVDVQTRHRALVDQHIQGARTSLAEQRALKAEDSDQ